MNAHELFHAGKLREALAAATDEVRARPTDAGRRLLLAEFLCLSGDLERADNHLDAIAASDPQVMTGVVAFRHLIRAEQTRQAFFAQGHLPSFLGRPEGAVRQLIDGSIALRAGDQAEALAHFEAAEVVRIKPRGQAESTPFDDFRDLDDRTACVIEVLTAKGDYYWIPIERIESIEFREPTRPRDLLWRRALIAVTDGPDGEVCIPALYQGTAAEPDDLIRIGRTTDWRSERGGPTFGVGQRTFLVGDEAIPILELKTITFESGASAEESAERGAGSG